MREYSHVAPLSSPVWGREVASVRGIIWAGISWPVGWNQGGIPLYHGDAQGPQLHPSSGHRSSICLSVFLFVCSSIQQASTMCQLCIRLCGDSEGQGSLACCSPWGHKESNMTWRLNNNLQTLGCDRNRARPRSLPTCCSGSGPETSSAVVSAGSW